MSNTKANQGKYQKILSKNELDANDLVILGRSKKIKALMGALVIISHNKETYIKLMDKATFANIEQGEKLL